MKLLQMLLTGLITLSTSLSYSMFLQPKPKIKPALQGFKKQKTTQRDKDIAYTVNLYLQEAYAGSNKKSRSLNKCSIILIAQRALALHTGLPIEEIQKACALAAQ